MLQHISGMNERIGSGLIIFGVPILYFSFNPLMRGEVLGILGYLLGFGMIVFGLVSGYVRVSEESESVERTEGDV